MSNSESSLVRPTQPGTPWAPPQPLTQGSDPTVPTAPELNPVPEGPSDRIRPVDPTIPMALTDADSLLSVAAPEGMVRITHGDQSRFCFPCHMDGWQALGWTAHPPGLAGGDGEDGGGSPPNPPDPPAALPTITAIKGGPFVVKGEVVEAYVVGTGFSSDGDLEVRGESQAEAGDYNFLGATELSFQLDCSLINEPVRLPVVAVNGAGKSETYLVQVVAAGSAGAAVADALVAAPLTDYAAMTKAQIIAEVERRYGVALDPGMTKAELVAEAERLAAKGPASAVPIAELDEPLADDQEPALPLDLLR
ncbi:hypothetical protein KBZ18_12065 [Synechococcus sp. Cruz-9H2]|uniref:hypothetical protein n=1 Tax=unclassified Synechococcus TaxID=2626047 RepID=UPI0020CB8948|nr:MULTISPECIES: hypothetical protein [unclassified Synechococcus]MCP9820219.1 hypothetical protein [Synechococcus sp. Cruz-9H2]MCP9844541.1 hypothetical protein [Synechococcus sp. Edmonson 11F2]MCP9856649.1 hypothetical protein [Synechococcus sp. Cruz-9C9]MCP9863934.1 hypothetical protein [Synechococcus sp. Cruz-7E5]MCP9871144.1 hypothetical protein [Synechococcus sp. Cruz-7B9]